MGRRREKGRRVDGILVLDKPVGIGSNEVLQRVKRLFGARKAGHTGSLDRLACGLLPLCFGTATKLSGFLLNADKRYLATVRLGEKSATGDAEGEIISEREVPPLTPELVEPHLERFRGDIEQIPPMHSALKHKGKRLYQLAHEGIVVDRPPRPVRITRLDLLDLDGVFLKIDVECSKGTYIRTLAEDIGESIGCGARVDALRRIGAGPFLADEMHDMDEIDEAARGGIAALDALLLPLESALGHWPSVSLSEGVAFYLRKGQPVLVPHAPTEGLVRLYAEPHRFIGVGEVLDDGRVAPRRLLESA